MIQRRIRSFSYREAGVFIVCLALSSTLWLLNNLEKRYTSRIIVPVNYIDFPADRQLAGNLPKTFDLLVDAYGYTLLSYKLRLAFSPVQLNVGELVDNSLDRYTRSKYLISTVNHKEEIEKQISNEIKILSIKPDTLIFNFSKIVSRKLPVRPNLQLDFDNQYSLQDVPVTNPDSVIVSGPKSAMDTMHCIRTAFKSFQNIQHSVREAISLISLPGFRYSEEHVTLQIPVEQNTEVSFEVPIQIHNCPKEVILKCFPGKVKVSCRIGFSKFKKLDYNAFHAYVSYDRLSLKESRIPVQLESLSNSAFAIRYSPHEVEYIIEHDNK